MDHHQHTIDTTGIYWSDSRKSIGKAQETIGKAKENHRKTILEKHHVLAGKTHELSTGPRLPGRYVTVITRGHLICISKGSRKEQA